VVAGRARTDLAATPLTLYSSLYYRTMACTQHTAGSVLAQGRSVLSTARRPCFFLPAGLVLPPASGTCATGVACTGLDRRMSREAGLERAPWQNGKQCPSQLDACPATCKLPLGTSPLLPLPAPRLTAGYCGASR